MVDIRERLKQERANIRDTIPAPSGRTISVKGKVFTFPDSKTSQGPIKAVILDHRNLYKYYDAPYDAKKPVPPACFALSKVIELKPHADARKPQAESCAECTWNKWGSASQGNGKACKNTVRLAIAAPDMTANDEPLMINVSPTGTKSWAALVNALDVTGKMPIEVVTEIRFDANQAYPTLIFKAEQPISDEQLATMWALREKAQAMLDQVPAGDQ